MYDRLFARSRSVERRPRTLRKILKSSNTDVCKDMEHRPSFHAADRVLIDDTSILETLLSKL